MKKVVFPNGLTIIFEKKKRSSVVVEVMVKTGSNYESDEERGIAHFIEHMLFEGTSSKPNNREISNEIEKIGGDFNAYTTGERTCFHIKVLKKHFLKAIGILADIFQNSLFEEKHLQKEKNIVIKEIEMVNDEPRYYQWILFQKTIFQKHPAKHPTYGDPKVIMSLDREKVIKYFEKYYVPNNIVISIVGDVSNWRKEIEEKFIFKAKKIQRKPMPKEPALRYNIVKKEKKKIANTYLGLGFKTVPRNHPDSYVFEVINGILGRGQSGRMFTEIRSNLGLAYDVGTQHLSDTSFGFFAVNVTIDRKNIALVKKLILKEINNLKNISNMDLQEAKDYIEGSYLLEIEDSQKMADQILFWEQVKNAEEMNTYLQKIKKVTRHDIIKVLDRYCKYYAMTIVEGK